MKRLALILALIVSAFSVSAQDRPVRDWKNHNVTSAVIVNAGKDCIKAISETTQTTDDNTGYAYMEGGFGLNGSPNYFYTQLFWEQKFWDFPAFAHAEFRTTLIDGQFYNTYYGGAALCLYSEHGFAAAEPLYRYAKGDGHGYQLSIVGGWEWRWCELAQFTDWWGCQSSSLVPNNIYSETRFYVKVTKRFRVGAVGILSYSKSGGFQPSIFGGVKLML